MESGIRVLSLVDFGQNEVYEVPDVVLIEGPLVLQDVRPDHFLSQWTVIELNKALNVWSNSGYSHSVTKLS